MFPMKKTSSPMNDMLTQKSLVDHVQSPSPQNQMFTIFGLRVEGWRDVLPQHHVLTGL